LLVHALLSPAVLRYELLLDLRRAELRRAEADGEPGRIPTTRWAEVVLPCALALLVFAATWLWLDAATAREGTMRAVLLTAGLTGCVVLPVSTLLVLRVSGGADEVVLTLAASFLRGATPLLRPLLAPAAWFTRRLAMVDEFTVHSAAEQDEQLAEVIEVESQQGDLSILQSHLLRRELDFVRKCAADVMVPRVDVEYLDVDMTLDEARQQIVESRFSRFPVREGSVDNVVAVLHAKSVLPFAHGEAPETLRKVLVLTLPRKPLHVRFDLPLEDVLEQLKREKASLAVVDDEYGGVAGILTVEDVVEEIVGEIVDESDAEAVRETVVCSGRRLLSELAEHGIAVPGDPELSIAELLSEKLGGEPRAGQAWAFGNGRVVVEATDADGGIDTVLVEQVWPAHGRGPVEPGGDAS
jgi:magnesium and cobalt transporter